MKGSNKIRKPGLIDREALGRIFSASEITDYRLKKSQEEINKAFENVDALLEQINQIQDLDIEGLSDDLSTLETRMNETQIKRRYLGSDSTSMMIKPNVFYVWGTVSSLQIFLDTADSSLYQEYIFQFTSGDTPTTLSLPSSIKWSAAPVIEANKTYQISILENIGTVISVYE